MEHEGKHYDLQAQLFSDEPCLGCAFEKLPCCMEIAGTECSRGGWWIWQLVENK